MLTLRVRAETFPLNQPFTLARGTKSDAHVVVAEITDPQSGVTGRGEAVPYARFGETVPAVIAAMEAFARELRGNDMQAHLQERLSPGAARNAIDCALWDLEAKRRGVRIWQLLGEDPPVSLVTAFTLSYDTPERMAEAARAAFTRPVLKLKLGREGVRERVEAVAAAAPAARLIVDANESWDLAALQALAPELARLGVALIEQPIPAGTDDALAGIHTPIPLCADESCHTRAELEALARRYQVINIKLDKTGGLTEALALKREAHARGLGIMVGCMVATSLAMAPACLIAQGVEFVDLDGPLLLARDRIPGLRYDGSVLHPPDAEVWG